MTWTDSNSTASHPFLCGRHKASQSRPWRQSKFRPAEPWLTLRKVSRDPFSMNSVMIITGLPTGTQHTTAVNEAKLQGRNTPTIKRRGQRRSRVCSCDQPLSASPCSSLGDNMACRHQSHWQLLINPLHKRQEIIRIDQSSRMCVCVCACVCVFEGASWDLMNTNQPQGKGVVVWSLCTCTCMSVC